MYIFVWSADFNCGSQPANLYILSGFIENSIAHKLSSANLLEYLICPAVY